MPFLLDSPTNHHMCCVFAEAPPRAFSTRPVWLPAIARSHLLPGLTANGGERLFLISCPDMKKKKGGKKKQSKQLWIMGAVKEKYRPGRWKGNGGDARVKDRLPASRNNVFSSWKNSLTEGRLLFPLERAH